MIFETALVLVLVWCVMKYVARPGIKLPGPRGYPFFGVSNELVSHKFHVMTTEWAREHGPLYQFTVLGVPVVVVTGFEAIYEATVTKGHEFGDRVDAFRKDVALQRTGILTSSKTDERWKQLRKTSHRHLKQFGDGLSRLENVIKEVGEDMFINFRDNTGKPYDPKQIVFDTALNSIAFLITGQRTRTGDSIVEKMRDYEVQFLRYLSRNGPVRYFVIDVFPWTRFLGLEIWKRVTAFVNLEKDIWNEIMKMNEDDPDSHSLCNILMSHAKAGGLLSETDARRTSMNLLLAGVTTTSNTFYAAINILAHHLDIQKTMAKEISSVCGENEAVTLKQRAQLPYCRAFLYELLRYTSVVAAGVGHCVRDDNVSLGGIHIPKATRLVINIWGLHHDPEFWGDPQNFRPDRFLDKDGETVTADHPNRRHLMPFGAGVRVCLGESLAMARLFLWITTLVQRFDVAPAEGNTASSLDTKRFIFEGVLRPTPFQVIFTAK